MTPDDAIERMVLVGRRYTNLSNHWTESPSSFDAAVEMMTERRADTKVSTAADEILEVVVVRRVRLSAKVTAEEVAVS